MESKKEFSTEKLNDFLKKVDKKLETNTEVLGIENKDILKSWINELNNTKEKTITVDINKAMYEKNVNIQKKDFDKMNIKINDNIINQNNNSINKANIENNNIE